MSERSRSAARAVKREARRLGFEKVGIARAEPPEEARHLKEWLSAGMHGSMAYMAREPEDRADIRRRHPWARRVVSVARSYYVDARDPGPGRARISRYALGKDYHDRLLADLERLAAFVGSRFGGRTRIAVDHSAILERGYARAAGIGWFGKNTMILAKDLGSFFFLGELLTDVELEPDLPYRRNYCGRCTRCIDLCPTRAIVAPYRLDARRCISYLTIEHRGVIDRELRPLMGNRVFGCDVCQDVCPWNRFARLATAEDFKPRGDLAAAELGGFMGMTVEEFRERFRKSPIRRAKRDGFLRNVAIALGNSGSPEAVGPLGIGLADGSPLVRLHSAWALGRIGGERARRLLRERYGVEKDPQVLEEIRLALGECGG